MIDTSKKTTRKRPTPIDESPTVIGCIGGSGSRLVSQLFIDRNYYFGHCTNQANDNLWFSFIFRRLKAVTSNYDDFVKLMDIFVSKMTTGMLNSEQKMIINQISNKPHPLAESFRLKSVSSLHNNDETHAKISKNWGWKEPNSHLFIPQLNQYFPQLKYIYIIRHPLDMAFSQNQNQLKFWGKHFLGNNCETSPYYSLKFWLFIYTKILKLKQTMGDRLYILNFDELIQSPIESVKNLFDNMGFSYTESSISQATKIVKTPQSIGRYKNHSLKEFDKKDLETLNNLNLFGKIEY